MCDDSKKSFEEIFNEVEGVVDESNINKLLQALDARVVRIIRHVYKKVSNDIDMDDIAQIVRIHIWKILTSTTYLNGKTGTEASKYLTTTIRVWAVRTISRIKKKIQIQNKVSKRASVKGKQENYISWLTLSIFNPDILNNKASIPCDVLVNRLKDACANIPKANIVFDFLAPTEDNPQKTEEEEIEYAGMPINAFYNIVNLIKEKAKEINYE